MIKNRKMINFLDEKKEEKYFKCVLIILIYSIIMPIYYITMVLHFYSSTLQFF